MNVSILVTCPDHGDITITPDDMLMADTIVIAHCAASDHLLERPLNEQTARVLKAADVEQLCP